MKKIFKILMVIVLGLFLISATSSEPASRKGKYEFIPTAGCIFVGNTQTGKIETVYNVSRMTSGKIELDERAIKTF